MDVKYDTYQATWTYEGDKGTVTAWYHDVPKGLKGEQIGVIGAFRASDEAVALELIQNAVSYLEEHKVAYIVGPMNQNTWHSYRFLIETERLNPFFMEPSQPKEYVEWFQKAGFLPHQNYYSFSNELIHFTKSKEEIELFYREKSIIIQDGSDFTDEEILKMNYDISKQSFIHNIYYTPIGYEEYENIYMPAISMLQKKYLYYAFAEQKSIAFLLGIPDFAQIKNGQPLKTILFKTFAVLPEYQKLGLATALMNCVADVAKENGLTNGVMALVHEHNHTMHMLPNQHMCSHYVLYRRDCCE